MLGGDMVVVVVVVGFVVVCCKAWKTIGSGTTTSSSKPSNARMLESNQRGTTPRRDRKRTGSPTLHGTNGTRGPTPIPQGYRGYQTGPFDAASTTPTTMHHCGRRRRIRSFSRRRRTPGAVAASLVVLVANNCEGKQPLLWSGHTQNREWTTTTRKVGTQQGRSCRHHHHGPFEFDITTTQSLVVVACCTLFQT